MTYTPTTNDDQRMEYRAKWAAPHIYGEHAAIHQLLDELAHAEAVMKWQEKSLTEKTERIKTLEGLIEKMQEARDEDF